MPMVSPICRVAILLLPMLIGTISTIILKKATYGLLYNWKAVTRNSSSSSSNPSNVQGICPTGWHVPSDAEWTQLTNYVSSQSEYVCGNDEENIAKVLASTTGWNISTNTCAVGNIFTFHLSLFTFHLSI